jgi:hypothetical protein
VLFLLSCINNVAGPAVWRRSGLGRHFVGATFLVSPAILSKQWSKCVDRWWNRLTQVTFALFVGGLVALLIILYAGVPIV